MPRTPRQSLQTALLLLIATGVLLSAAHFSREFVPATWRTGSGWPPGAARTRYGGPLPLAVSGQLRGGDAYSLVSHVTARPKGWFVMTGLELTVSPISIAVNNTPATDPGRVLNEVGTSALKSQCTAMLSGAPDAPALVEQAFASPGILISHTFPARRWADWLLTARAVLLCVCWIALFAAATWCCVCIYRLIAQRREARLTGCPGCGYAIAQLPPQTPCPECGLLPPHTGEFYQGQLNRRMKQPPQE